MDTTNPNFKNLSRAFFSEDAARELLEAVRWPKGAVCPHCKSGEAYKLTPKAESLRPVRAGVYKCKSCRKQFTVTVGTIFERSKIALNKWMLAVSLMTSSKKGVSAHQIHRTLGVTYKTAWFMCHRIRMAMERDPMAGLLGGIVEADETYVGGKQVGTGGGHQDPKAVVMTIVQRNGEARTQVVPDNRAETLQSALLDEADPSAHIMTDGLASYRGLNRAFAEHSSIDHDKAYVCGIVHTNTAESLFSLLKRGILGTFHHVSKKHLHRYVSEFDFRWNARKVKDGERLVSAILAVGGKRLMYRQLTANNFAF